MKTASKLSGFVRTYFAIAAALSLLAMIQTQVQTQALQKFRTRYKWVVLLIVFAVNLAMGAYVALRGDRLLAGIRWPRPKRVPRIATKLTGILLLALPVPLFLLARQDFFGTGAEGFFRLLWLFWWLALVQAAGIALAVGWDWSRAMVAVLLLDGMAAQVFTLSTAVSSYPFSMGWSEASRYYYGSLVFSRSLYGERLPLSIMHGSRYLLQSVPFLLGQIPLWVARCWQVLLWIGLTLLSAGALARRLRSRTSLGVAAMTAGLFLFYFQGAVYYHLQLCVDLVFVGVSMGRPRLSLASVVLASFWAGMSRVNWLPVPAMLAIALYLAESPYVSRGGLWRYFRIPVWWATAGVVCGLAGQAFYVAISGNTDLGAFASSFTSALLWYRWWPSATNSLGIIPGVIVVSLPVVGIFVWRLQREARAIHWLRLAGMAGLLATLLAMGLIVSTKIGGGGDLHNMDAFLVLLSVFGAYCIKPMVALDRRVGSTRPDASPTRMVTLALVPVAFALLRIGQPFMYDAARARADLTTLGQEIRAYSGTGEVVFMYERHLQTFGLVPRIPMVADYEVLTLMEMAISGNEGYLNRFYGDLRSHRFAAIVTHPQNLGVETGDFLEENDAWTRWVARPLLCQYKPALTLDYSKIQILVPRAKPCSEFPPSFAG